MRTDILRDPVDGAAAVAVGPPTPGLVGPERIGRHSQPIGVTDAVVDMSNGSAYPVVDGIPILIRPERLSQPGSGSAEPFDIENSIFAEAYAEGRLYSDLATGPIGDRSLARLEHIFHSVAEDSFPDRMDRWVDPGTTAGPYRLAMTHLAGPRHSVVGQTVLQIGGTGTHALRLLHAGAANAVVVSPMVDELRQGRAMAEILGVSDRATFVGGVAEELPLVDSCVSIAYSGSSMHHTVTARAVPEVVRVLEPAGRFASVDVWKGRFHAVGTRVFGKRHGNVHCSPLDRDRLAPALDGFAEAEISYHGCLLRYPLAVLTRVGLDVPPPANLWLSTLEDSVPLGPLTEPLASIVCIRGRT